MNIRCAIITFILLISCNSQNSIIGEWECYGDSYYSGQIIKIEKIGNYYHGIRVNMIKDDEIKGWAKGDICWKNIVYVEKGKYKVIRVIKGIRNGEQYLRDNEGLITIESREILVIHSLVTEKGIIGEGKELRYKRI